MNASEVIERIAVDTGSAWYGSRMVVTDPNGGEWFLLNEKHGACECDVCHAKVVGVLTHTPPPTPVEPDPNCYDCGGDGTHMERDPDTGQGARVVCDCVTDQERNRDEDEWTRCPDCWLEQYPAAREYHTVEDAGGDVYWAGAGFDAALKAAEEKLLEGESGTYEIGTLDEWLGTVSTSPTADWVFIPKGYVLGRSGRPVPGPRTA